jgi:hypothetical protein
MRKTRNGGRRSDHPVEENEDEEVEWIPPEHGSWEGLVMAVDTMEEELDESGQKCRNVYLAWNNGRKSVHSLKVARAKCPQKVCSEILHICPMEC